MSSPTLRRAFVAVVPPAVVAHAIEAVVAPVRAAAPPGFAWARRAQWHLTLQFLGPVADVERLCDSLVGNLHGRRPVTLGLGGAGAFPSATRASVLWIGVDDGRDDLAGLAGAVERATEPLGYGCDPRPFQPHVTLARGRRPRSVTSLLAALGDGPVGPRWDVTEVVLMESDTRPTGAVYREVAVFALRS